MSVDIRKGGRNTGASQVLARPAPPASMQSQREPSIGEKTIDADDGGLKFTAIAVVGDKVICQSVIDFPTMRRKDIDFERGLIASAMKRKYPGSEIFFSAVEKAAA